MQGLKFSACALLFATSLPVAANESEQTDDAGSYTLETAPVKLDVELSCVFETECLEADTCNDTTFSFDLIGKAGGLTDVDMVVQAEIVSEIGDTVVLGARSGTAMSLAGGTFDARHLLTIAAGGDARYTLHYSDGPMAISYLGACS